METKCPKCRTKDFENCHSIRCPMRNETIKSDNTQTLANTLQQIEKLEAEKAELLEALEEINSKLNNMHLTDDRLTAIYNTNRSLIQKMKQ